MPLNGDAEFWSKVTSWLAGIAAALVAFVWGDMRAKVRKLDEKLDTKVGKDELAQERERIHALAEADAEIKALISFELREVTRYMNNIEKITVKLEERSQNAEHKLSEIGHKIDDRKQRRDIQDD